MSGVRRRRFLFIAAAIFATPRYALGQEPPKVRRIGFLAARSRSTSTNPDVYYDAFMQEMHRLGYDDGRNLVVEWRFADGKYQRLPALAAELAGANLEVIVTHALPPTRAAMASTSTIPIVFASMVDPVANRVVASLGRPGGNVTGLSLMGNDVSPKRIELLRELIPGMAKVAFLANPLSPAHPAMLRTTESAGQALGVSVFAVYAEDEEQIDRGFETMVRERANAVIVPDDTFFLQQRRQICALALKHRIPSIFPYAENVESGGLMSYGQNLPGFYRKAAILVDRILRGAKPADLPVEQPTTFELIINRKTASALGLKIPQRLLLRADRVIE